MPMKVSDSHPSSNKKLTPRPTKDHRRREHTLFLTLQELELMKIIWDRGEASVAQVKETYGADYKLAYTTIMTVLSRLQKKGMLKQRKSGKAFYYSAVHPREKLAEVGVDNLARIFFSGSREAMAEFCRSGRLRTPVEPKRKAEPAGIDETLL